MTADHVFRNARLVTMAGEGMGLIERGAVVVAGGRIAFAGPDNDLPTGLGRAEIIDCEGRVVTPGLIDCHTHLVFGGNRAREFEMRLDGASYEDIARAGGGILSTVRATRAASEDDLIASALPRLDALLGEGVTTVEIKSGYGLTVADEVKTLRAARRLGTMRDVSVLTTALGAHAIPPEFAGRSGEYIEHVITEQMPALAAENLADAVDAFCEGIAFSPEEVDRLFTAARGMGLPVKLHADQLSNLHGAALAAKHGALSADHLEYTDAEGAAAMAGPERWPFCCPAPSISCARSSCRPSRNSGRRARKWRSRPIVIPVPRH